MNDRHLYMTVSIAVKVPNTVPATFEAEEAFGESYMRRLHNNEPLMHLMRIVSMHCDTTKEESKS